MLEPVGSEHGQKEQLRAGSGGRAAAAAGRRGLVASVGTAQAWGGRARFRTPGPRRARVPEGLFLNGIAAHGWESSPPLRGGEKSPRGAAGYSPLLALRAGPESAP